MSDSTAPTTGSSLKERLQADLTTAMRSRDDVSTATLRMILTAVRSEEVSGDTARELTDEQLQAVLRREAKKRKEASAAFAGAGRPEQAEREAAELTVVESYLPQQLGDDDLAAIVTDEVAAAASAGATGMAAMGRVIKAVQAKVAGRADGGRVAAEVKRRLAAS